MQNLRNFILPIAVISIAVLFSTAHADSYSNAVDVFKKSTAVQPFFKNSYGYVIFPTIGKGGFGIGGAYGKGQVYHGDEITGTASLIKLSIGWQAGAQAFSEIIFFQDERAYKEFTGGEFEFEAGVSAVAITAGVQAKTGTDGSTAGASAGPATGAQAKTNYKKGMAVFVHAKGGLMYEAAIGGQKFKFTPKK
jgi:lipid-binding SYLF domain-containing protein